MRSTAALVRFVLILLCALSCGALHARLVRTWDFASLDKEAEVLVVGEVVSAVVASKLNAGDSHWNAPLVKMTATIRVIRVLGTSNPEFAAGKLFSVDYLNIDNERPVSMADGPNFPALSQGMVRIFPIRQNKDKKWELLDEEDNDMLLPATAEVEKCSVDAKAIAALIGQLAVESFEAREKAQTELIALGWPVVSQLKAAIEAAADAEVKNRLQKILEKLDGNSRIGAMRAEYAYTLARGDGRTRFSLGNWYGLRPDDAGCVDAHLARILGKERDAWMPVLALLYAQTYAENVTLTEWASSEKDPDRNGGKRKLAKLIWPRIQHEKLDEQIITQAFASGVPYASTLQLLRGNNLAEHVLTTKLLLSALSADSPDGVALAFQFLIQPKPLDGIAAPAVAAALKLIAVDPMPEHDAFYSACQIIVRFGGPKERGALLEEFTKDQKSNVKKYLKIWQSLDWLKDKKTIPFCAVVLNDAALRPEGDMRNCDMAVFSIEYAADQKFGIDAKTSIEERNAAVEKAKAWVAAHGND